MAKHPNHQRMQGILGQKNGDSWSKQPRALKDGNWVCDDSQCNNVNYPRRTECHKCKKKRGPAGDAVVRAYLESLNASRREFLKQSAMGCPVVRSREHIAMVRGMFPHNAFEIAHQKHLPIVPNFTSDFNPWMRTGFEQISPFRLQYVGDNRGVPGCRFMPRAASETEGKHLAEHLVASFTTSADPFNDAGECLASAAVWLQNMKSRGQTAECHIPTSFVATESATVGGIPFAGPRGTINMQSPAEIGNFTPPRNSPEVQQTHVRCEDFSYHSHDFLKGNPWSLPEVL